MNYEELIRKKLREKGLRGPEFEFVYNWIIGMARKVAEGPPGEPPEETEKEYQEVLRLFYEKLDEMLLMAKRWKERLLRAVAL